VNSAYVITGGTGALGRAVVELLLRQGHLVAVPYRGERGFEELREAAGDKAEALFGAPADIADTAAAAGFVSQTVERFGGIDGAALLAGAYASTGNFESAAESEWEQMLRANLHSVYAAARALLPELLKKGGSVVTVGSSYAAAGGAGAAAYAVSKNAVAALTRTLALENRARGVRFNLIEPGIIDTPANRSAMPTADTSQWTPPRRIAEVVAFLLSRESAPASGSVIPVAGAAPDPA
jgi:NAD(P)-dependent dehydrogenase (short-subunit alcohol dehydrogenase family)